MNTRTARKQGKKYNKQQKVLILISIILVTFIAITGSISVWGVHKLRDIAGGMYKPLNNVTEEQQEERSNKVSARRLEGVNVLILGVDTNTSANTRSDTTMIATINPHTQKIMLTSIPRDTYASIPGYHSTKINHAMAYGGPQLAITTVEKFLGIKIDYYLTVNFDGFREAIDVLGGVYVNVERNMRYVDVAGGLDINLKKGYQLLDGKNALDFVRYRNDGEGDFGRVRRQQELLRALAERATATTAITKTFPFLEAVSKGISTDIHPTTMEAMVKQLIGIRGADVISQEVASRAYMGSDDISYVEIKPEERQRIAREMTAFLQKKTSN